MNAARERILARIRAAVSGERKTDWRAELDRRMAQKPKLIRPMLHDNVFECFIEKLAEGGGSCEQVASIEGASSAIAKFLNALGLPLKVRVAPALLDMQWVDGFEISYGNTRGEDLVSVTPAFCAVAETGSAVLLSERSEPHLT